MMNALVPLLGGSLSRISLDPGRLLMKNWLMLRSFYKHKKKVKINKLKIRRTEAKIRRGLILSKRC